jgi:membrane protein YdbS with pleckstrin-like domain
MALVAAAVMLAAAVGVVVLLTVVDPNPVALVFLVLAAGSAVASIVLFVIAGVRYSRGR